MTITRKRLHRRLRAGVLLASLVLLAPAVGRAEATAAVVKVTAIEGVTEHRLANGLRILTYPDPSTPKLTVMCTVFAGSRHEGHGETGMAHLLEHMNIKCTPTLPDIKKALSDRGADWNAYTTKDRTNFFETLAGTEDNLEFAICLEAERLTHSLIRREDLLSEMTVVRNEFEKFENMPGVILQQRMLGVAYEWHNYGKAVIGNRSDIERIPVENLRAFYRKHYRPDNALLIVTGKFDEPKALAFAERYFGPLKNPAGQLDQTSTEEPPQDGERFVTLRRVGTTAQVAAVYHIPAAAHPDFAALTILAQALSTEPHGRLYKTLVASKKSSSIAAVAAPMHDPSVFLIGAQVNNGQAADDVRQALLDAIENLGTNKLTEAEVHHARGELSNGWHNLTSRRLADELCDWAARGDWRLVFLHRDRLANVTAEDVNSVAVRYLVRTNRTVGLYVPTEKPERAEIPAAPDLVSLLLDYKGSQVIAAGEEFDPTPENIEQRVRRLTLPSGVKAALLPRKTRGETVILQLTLHYGNEQSLAGLNEVCELLPMLMRRGTRQHDYKALDLELPKLGNPSINAAGGLGVAVFTIQCQRQYLPEVLKLVGEMLREPTLAPDELETLRRAAVEGLRSQLKEPGPLALFALRRKLHPHAKDNVRYVATLDELVARCQALTLEQFRRLYTEQFGGAHGELTVVGDFDPDATLRQVQELLTGWKSPTEYRRIADPANTEVGGAYQVIDTPDKANAFYRAGHVLAQRPTDPDYVALLVGNYILGQPATASRLWKRIREQDGLSYSVASDYSVGDLDPAGGFEFLAICNPANMPKVRRAMAEEIEKLLKDGVTQAELNAAKEAILAERRTFTDAQIAGALASYLIDGDSFAAYAERSKKIGQLTVAQVNAAVRQHLEPRKLVIVEAGDFEKSKASR